MSSVTLQEQNANLVKRVEELEKQLAEAQGGKIKPLPKGEYYRAICPGCLKTVDIAKEKWQCIVPKILVGKYVKYGDPHIITDCTNCGEKIKFGQDFDVNVRMRRIFLIKQE